MRNSTHIVLEEAYALALEGRAPEALQLLEQLEGDGAVLLARARCQEEPDGVALLEALAGAAGPARWRAQVALARRRHRAGDTAAAAQLVKAALEAVRDGGDAADGPLAKLVSLEVEHLRSTPATRGDSSYSAEDLLALLELGRAIGTLTDPAGVLGTVLHEAIRLTGADRGFVVLGSEPPEVIVAENLDRSKIDEPAFEVSRTLIREVGRTGKTALVTLASLPESHPASQSLGVLGVRSVACVPLFVPGNAGAAPAGALYLDARQHRSGLRTKHVPLLELLARQAATALANARAHREAALTLERAEETIRRQHAAEPRARFDTIVGASPAMQDVYARLDRIVASSEPVILQGETGTGKELVARLIHDRGPRAGREFVAVNCAGLAESLLESELFGHERGAFTGADRARAGLIEVAHRGTLFLDEIADMPPRMQGDLLRTLQSGEVRRLGGRETLRVDVRVLVASNRDLEREVARGRFREDLFYRLDVLRLTLPPLRDRTEDIPLLVQELSTGKLRITERALSRLQAHSWPGNVRELGNFLRRVAAHGLEAIDEGDLPSDLRGAPARPAPAGTLEQAEEQAIRRAMRASAGNKSRAAKMLGVDRKTLYVKLRRLGLL